MALVLHHLITRQSQQQPDAFAIIQNQERWTYGQLEEASNRLARLLKEAGCVRGDRVCFLMPKSPTAILCQIGILKADCAYVPLDSSSPAERLAKIVESCEPRVILAAGPVAKLLGEALVAAQLNDSPIIGWMDSNTTAVQSFTPRFTRDDLAAQSGEALDYRNTGEDVAHILFTSGSTGTPKGVMIKHSNVLAYIDWAIKYFGTT
ncbi:MAG: AMP-binding protein, partial [Blastocatellia bacterium]